MIQAIILGIVQGLTEFLPVSSSAHLILIPLLMDWKQMGIDFDVALHFGSTLAVISFFYSDILAMFKGLYSLILNKGSLEDKKYGKLSIYILISMIPAGVAVFTVKDYVEEVRGNYTLIASMLILVGIFLFFSDRMKNLNKTTGDITAFSAFIIGIAQAFAMIPGVSRSGATILCGLMFGLKKEEAARFSFLMAIPVITGAALLSVKDILDKEVSADFIMSMSIGTLTSAISGFLCIKYFLKYLKDGGFTPFAIYRVILGLFFLLYFLR